MLLLPLPNSQRVQDPLDSAKKTAQPKSSGGPPAAPKRVNKRKTRAERGCPEELRKYNMKVASGQICWNYNLKDGCQLPTNGKPARCQRGLHLCACCHKPGHSVVVCRDVKSA